MFANLTEDGDNAVVSLLGRWRAEQVGEIARAVCTFPPPRARRVCLDGSAIESLDLTGASLLRRLELRLENAGATVAWRTQRPAPLDLAQHMVGESSLGPPPHSRGTVLQWLGRATVAHGRQLLSSLAFLGRVVTDLLRAGVDSRRRRPASIARHVLETGVQATPIVALIAFLISVIVAYIGAEELHQFGGDLFVVDLVTLSVLRELGVLLTAIIVAGRSGSAFAAELGAMQLNEEIDALRAIGVDPTEVLVLPRLIGLTIALPLLTIVADAMGLAGGALLSWFVIDIPPNQFAARMQQALSPTTFWAGLLKAPVFACAIAMIGTYCGMQVRGSSRELGRLTTQAVVHSIFMVLLVDAVFAVLYWKIKF
jgi:phospholipid/cholesterol/gamma-HCH transport system permease protein